MNKRFTFSKALTFVFIVTFGLCLYKTFTMDFSSVIDATPIITAITVTGGIMGTCVVFYMKKSQSENIPKIQTGLYKETMSIRLDYNEKMMKLKKQYQMSDEEIMEIETESVMEEVSDGVLNTAFNEIDAMTSEAHESVELQNY